MNNIKKRILVISPNFSGGGLETRIKTIIERFHEEFSYSLLTKTPTHEMRISPSKFINKIYNWDKQDIAINDADIISIHPFSVFTELKNLHLLDNKKLIYTLHGEASFLDNINSFGDKIDIFYSVSEKLIQIFKILYPQYSNKIYLFKNYYPKQNKTLYKKFKTNKNILISITNTEKQGYLNNIIKRIPHDYCIHIIGSEQFQQFEHPNVVYDGFVNINSYLSKNQFCIAFTRGGYAAMDLIVHGIPLILIYERNSKFYAEVLNRNDFEKLSNQNFVTFKESRYEDIPDIIRLISLNHNNFELFNLLKKYNDYSSMYNPYSCIEGEVYAK